MKSGPKPKGKVKIKWSSHFAYAVGLLVTDGCLSKDGRHIDFTSKDYQQLENFLQCLGIKNKISKKRSGYGIKKLYTRIQFSDVLFYKFLLSIGLTPAKSHTLAEIDMPKKYFFDFLLGEFDGDGCFYSYYDPRWPSSFMFYTVFISASKDHILWVRKEIAQRLGITGHMNRGGKGTYQLKYAKRDSLLLLRALYSSKKLVYLKRKRLKIDKALAIIGITL
jgi:hypothetical protein